MEFRYDALGRRTAKQYFGKVTRWVWDGNVPIHEWGYKVTDRQPNEEENTPSKEPTEDITTWVFEAGTFVPTAKIQDGKQYSIVSDYLGTPIQMYDEQGNKTWDCTLDAYGKVTTFEGCYLNECPFRFQGQYADEETGLYYNRFRYYSPNKGNYISQDPIELFGNNPTIYGYVTNPNRYIDFWGLHEMQGTIFSEKSGNIIFSDVYSSGGQKKGRLNFQEQLETHTERQFLNDAKEIVLPGNHLKMSGTLNPCKPGCQPAIRRFVLNNNVTAEYSANNKKFEWYKSGDGKVIQIENGVKYEYSYDSNGKQIGKRKKCNH